MAGETINDTGEFGLIRRIAKPCLHGPAVVKVGNGDDAAVYATDSRYDEMVSTDTLVEGIHFTAQTLPPSDVGWKLCAVNFSDMAAMGGWPTGFVISAALPGTLPVSWVEECYEGIRACCETYHVNLLGGDITGSPKGIILTGTVIGQVPQDGAITRGGARVGDLVVVTGTLGDSAAGLDAILSGNRKEFPSLLRRHRRPEPQIELASALRKAGATALDDISDGLSREANEIAAASGVTLDIEADRIPVSQDARQLGSILHKDPLLWALNGGEDYQLVGTISISNYKKLDGIQKITVIGKVMEHSEGIVCLADKTGKHLLEAHGYDHFA